MHDRTKTEYYVLDDEGNAVPAADLAAWSEWMTAGGIERRRIDRTNVDGQEVSTVFLGMDHRWGQGEPLLFETLIFEGDFDGNMWRWTTKAQAQRGHLAVVDALRHHETPPEEICPADIALTVAGIRHEVPCRLTAGHDGNHKAAVAGAR